MRWMGSLLAASMVVGCGSDEDPVRAGDLVEDYPGFAAFTADGERIEALANGRDGLVWCTASAPWSECVAKLHVGEPLDPEVWPEWHRFFATPDGEKVVVFDAAEPALSVLTDGGISSVSLPRCRLGRSAEVAFPSGGGLVVAYWCEVERSNRTIVTTLDLFAGSFEDASLTLLARDETGLCTFPEGRALIIEADGSVVVLCRETPRRIVDGALVGPDPWDELDLAALTLDASGRAMVFGTGDRIVVDGVETSGDAIVRARQIDGAWHKEAVAVLDPWEDGALVGLEPGGEGFVAISTFRVDYSRRILGLRLGPEGGQLERIAIDDRRLRAAHGEPPRILAGTYELRLYERQEEGWAAYDIATIGHAYGEGCGCTGTKVPSLVPVFTALVVLLARRLRPFAASPR